MLGVQLVSTVVHSVSFWYHFEVATKKTALYRARKARPANDLLKMFFFQFILFSFFLSKKSNEHLVEMVQ